MATALTLDQLTSLIESEPNAGSKTRGITIERNANVTAILNGETPAFDVTDEHKSDGEPYTLASLVQAYRNIVKARKVSDKVTVRKFAAAGKVIVGDAATVAKLAESLS